MVGETSKKHRKFETSALRRAPARLSLILADKREKLRETLVGRSPGVPPQSLRALLAGRGVRVHAVLTGPVDTDMSRGLDIAKASPESVARAIFDGVEKGEEGDLSRSHVRVHGRELAQRCGQGARAPECGATRSSVRQGISKGREKQ